MEMETPGLRFLPWCLPPFHTAASSPPLATLLSHTALGAGSCRKAAATFAGFGFGQRASTAPGCRACPLYTGCSSGCWRTGRSPWRALDLMPPWSLLGQPSEGPLWVLSRFQPPPLVHPPSQMPPPLTTPLSPGNPDPHPPHWFTSMYGQRLQAGHTCVGLSHPSFLKSQSSFIIGS